MLGASGAGPALLWVCPKARGDSGQVPGVPCVARRVAWCSEACPGRPGGWVWVRPRLILSGGLSVSVGPHGCEWGSQTQGAAAGEGAQALGVAGIECGCAAVCVILSLGVNHAWPWLCVCVCACVVVLCV